METKKENKSYPTIFDVVKMNKKEENTNCIKIPLGQRLLRKGYKFVNEEWIYNKLKIVELNKNLLNMEVENFFKKRMMKKEQYHIEYHYDTCRVKIEKKISFLSYHRWLICYRRWLMPTGFKLKRESLNKYTRDIIPDGCFNKIGKAENDGIKKFYVFYPSKMALDPVIIGIIAGGKMIFIDKWE